VGSVGHVCACDKTKSQAEKDTEFVLQQMSGFRTIVPCGDATEGSQVTGLQRLSVVCPLLCSPAVSCGPRQQIDDACHWQRCRKNSWATVWKYRKGEVLTARRRSRDARAMGFPWPQYRRFLRDMSPYKFCACI
jgi:hypothetical protein